MRPKSIVTHVPRTVALCRQLRQPVDLPAHRSHELGPSLGIGVVLPGGGRLQLLVEGEVGIELDRRLRDGNLGLTAVVSSLFQPVSPKSDPSSRYVE